MNVNLSALFASAPAAYTFPATWTEAHAALSMLSSERTGATRQRDEATSDGRAPSAIVPAKSSPRREPARSRPTLPSRCSMPRRTTIA